MAFASHQVQVVDVIVVRIVEADLPRIAVVFQLPIRRRSDHKMRRRIRHPAHAPGVADDDLMTGGVWFARGVHGRGGCRATVREDRIPAHFLQSTTHRLCAVIARAAQPAIATVPMPRYSAWSVLVNGLTGQRRWPRAWREVAPKNAYDIVIVGGGLHGLASAYYLAANHGARNIAVLEKGWLGGGNAGRNTTIVRSNYMMRVQRCGAVHLDRRHRHCRRQEVFSRTLFHRRGGRRKGAPRLVPFRRCGRAAALRGRQFLFLSGRSSSFSMPSMRALRTDAR